MPTISERLKSMPFRLIAFWALCVLWVSLTFSKALVEISFMTALIAWFGWKVQSRRLLPAFFPAAVWVPLLGFVLLSCVSHFWSENPAASFRGIFKVLQYVMLFILVADVMKTRRDIRRFEWVFIFLILFTVLNGLSQYLWDRDLLRGYKGIFSHSGLRITASFKSYGHLGAFMICSIPYLVFLSYRMRRREGKTWMGVVCILSVLGSFWLLYVTRSRGAYLAFLIGAGFFFIFKRQWKWILALALVCASLLAVLPRNVIFHFDTEFKEQSLVERYYLWDRALNVIRAKPLTGTGINTYASTHQKYDQTENWRVRDYYAHNGFLQTAAETGLPSLFFFLLFFFQYFRLSYRYKRSLEDPLERNIILGLLIGLLNFLLLSLVDTVMHNPQPVMIFWYLAGIQWTYQRADKNLT